MTSYMATVTILLVLWLLTLAALFASLRRCRQRLDRGTEAAPDLFMALASEKTRQARELLTALDQLHRLLGVVVLRLRGDGSLDPVHSSDTVRIGRDLMAALQREIKGLRADDGKETTLRVGGSIYLLRMVDGPDATLIIVEDVTSSFSMAEKMKESERLAALGKMGANMAHQLKTPLAILAGRAQMLKRRLTDPDALEVADEIYREARQLARQVGDVVELYRLREPRWEVVHMAAVLEGVKGRLKGIAPDLRVDTTAPPGLELKSDGVMLENLIFLVAENSTKPEVHASQVRIEAAAAPAGLRISVEDDGKGVEEGIVEELFEPFRSGSQEGLGLGLFLAQDLAGRLGGRIEAVPSASGARFLIHLPQDGPSKGRDRDRTGADRP